MTDHQAIAANIANRSQRRAAAIDEAMTASERMYHTLTSQDDPYAMHKAIESLPISVLLHFANRQTDHELIR